MLSLRNSIAHAASPWNWRSDAAVQAFVVVMCALPVAALLAGVGRSLSGDGPHALVWAVLTATLYFMLFTRPALRSLRRRRSLRAAQHRA